MLDPRVYRAAFIPAAFALIVAAFSLQEPPRGSGSSLAPDAFVGARAFAGRRLRQTLVLVSASGGRGGNAGASAWARAPGGPVDAVVVLGDLASSRVRGPLIVPWSNGLGIAPLGLQRTVALSLGLETGRRVPQTGVGSQFARLAVPLTPSEQGEVAVHGLPAVLLTVAGERGPGDARAVSQDRLQEMGRSTLRSITALDA